MWHDNVSWPVNGTYYCRTCLQVYPVKWANRLPQQLGQENSSIPPAPARTFTSQALESH
jgi:hypothetical protein